jgi:hypothetical protein
MGWFFLLLRFLFANADHNLVGFLFLFFLLYRLVFNNQVFFVFHRLPSNSPKVGWVDAVILSP